MSSLSRRAFMAVGLGVCMPGALRSETGVPPSGAVGLICTGRGISGLVLEGEAGARLDPRYRWHIGSNTKAMTAALYARLVDQGRCRWDASIPALFPSLPANSAWADLRIDDLLSHTAGLTDSIVDSTWLRARHGDPSPAREQRRRLVQQILASPPDGEPGRYRYGNLGYVMIGAAIEEAVDASWEEVMRAELFAPLGVREAGFGAPPRTGPWGRQGSGASARPVDPAGIADNPAILWPSGGAHLAAANYAQFLSLFLRRDRPFLRPATLDRLLTPSAPTIRYAGGWSLAGAASSPADRLAHDGSNTFWYASALIDRAKGSGYAAIINKGGDEGAAATARLINALRA